MPDPVLAPPDGYAQTYIDDTTLTQVIAIAAGLRQGDRISEAEAVLIMHALLPIAEELRERRRAFACLHRLTAPNVVRLFPAEEAGR